MTTRMVVTMDITAQFNSIVSDTEAKLQDNLQLKDKRDLDGEGTDDILLPDKNRILPKARRKKSKSPKDSFEVRAKDVVENITRLREFLAENRIAYIDVLNVSGNVAGQGGMSNDFCNSDSTSGSVFTDLDRDRVDAETNAFIRKTNQLITKFKADLKEKLDNREAKHLTAHQTQHLEAVCDILDDYLRVACKCHAKQKAIRVEKELEIQKLSRLEVNARSSCVGSSILDAPTAKYLHPAEIGDQFLESGSDAEIGTSNIKGDISSESSDVNGEVRKGSKVHRLKKKSHNTKGLNIQTNENENNLDLRQKNSTIPPSSAGYMYSSDDDLESNIQNDAENKLSPEEIQAYEQENEAMYEDLMSLRDNVEQIENKVVKIAQLQEIFTEKGKAIAVY